MTVDEIGTYLAGAGLGLTLGTNLFLIPLPLISPDKAVALDVYSGKPADRTFGGSLAVNANEYPEFQVFVRDVRENAREAMVLAYAIHRKLDNLGPVTLSGVVYRDVKGIAGEPKFLDFDQNQRPIYWCAYEAAKDPS